MQLQAEEILRIHVNCEKEYEIKDDGSGYLRVIPIVGGWFEGKLRGKVIPVGADWNTIKDHGINHVFAKYILQSEDGALIVIENEGKISLVEQERKIRTVPKFQADNEGKYAWLNSGVYVSELTSGGKEGRIEIVIYKLE